MMQEKEWTKFKLSIKNHFFYFTLEIYLKLNSRIFYSYGDVTITGEGLQILTCVRHSLPLSSWSS